MCSIVLCVQKEQKLRRTPAPKAQNGYINNQRNQLIMRLKMQEWHHLVGIEMN